MKSTNLKGKTFAIALILLLTLSSAVAILPAIKAQTLGSKFPYSYTPTKGANGLWNEPTFPGITISPNPVGVGQPVTVILIIELLPPSLGSEASTTVSGGWVGLTLTVTDLNGTVTTMGPYETTPSGDYSVTYTPTTVGTYTFQMNFPGQTVNGTGQGSYYANFMASTSDKVSLTVQQAPVQVFVEAPVPLPTQYWTQPISGQNRAWNVISGPWLMSTVWGNTGFNSTGTFNPYSYAPRSAHVLWTKSTGILQSGLVGGAYGSLAFQGEGGTVSTAEPGSIQSNFECPIIMGGYVYYASAPQVGNTQILGLNSSVADQAVTTESCANLQTGQVMWTVPLATISGGSTPAAITYGQILAWRSQQQRATLAYLWSIGSGSYKMYDAGTGALLAQWNNLPAGTTVATARATTVLNSPVTVLSGTVVHEQPHPTTVGTDIGGASGGGALLVYIYGRNSGQPTGWLACWNSTLAINSYYNNPVQWGGQSMSGQMIPSIQSQVQTPLDWNFGIMWNMTIPLTSTTSATGTSSPASWSILGADGNYVILKTGASSYRYDGTNYFTMAGVYVVNQPMTSTYTVGYGGIVQHVTSGTFAWIENITQPTLDQTLMGTALENGGYIVFADSNTLSVNAWSESTGQLLWSSNPYNNFFETQTLEAPGPVAYGMLYSPGYDGYMHALNITNGAQVWETPTRPGNGEMPEPGYPALGAYVADNVVFTCTGIAYEASPAYRGHCLYAYDATTGAQNWNISGEYSINAIADGILLAQNSYDGKEYAFSRGQSATTVSAPSNFITAGTPGIISGTVTDQTPGITQGTPAISDAWMTPWMEYMYMDQPYPTNAVGVPVSIDAIDPNGNYVHIGNATSDINGAYSYTWTPPNIPGTYNIIATFGSTNSYYGSSAEASAVVVSPAPATVSPTPTPTSVADMYFVPAVAGIIVLIVIVAVVLALLMLRKRP